MFLLRSAIAALLVIVALGGAAGFVSREESAEAAFLAEMKKLLASDGHDWDRFGQGVAVSGDTAFVAAPGWDVEDGHSGAVYVFERDEGDSDNWGEVKRLTASDARLYRGFGPAIAIDGDTAVVGGGLAVSVLERDEGGQGNWGEVKLLTSSSIEQLDERFGSSVAVNADTVVVGAHGHDLGDSEFGFGAFGAAYIFSRDQGGANNWGEVKLLIASNAEMYDMFGWGVAVSDDIVVVGAPWEDRGTKEAGDFVYRAGAAYVFERDAAGQDNWGEVAKFNAADPVNFAHLGESVAISGDTALVGARYWRPGDTSGPGAGYIFQRDEGGADNWGEVVRLTAADGEPGAQLGYGVALSGDIAVLGAPTHDEGGPGGNNFGAAYVFERDQGGADNWGEVDKLRASDPDIQDWFGRKVAVDGDTALIGARDEDASGESAGAAYVFETGGPGDSDQDGCTDKAEGGPDATLGGLRDKRHFWDFFDVWTHPTGQPTVWERDRVVNTFDILAVALRFGPGPKLSESDALAAALLPPADDTSYHAAFDRGPLVGANAWDRAPADGGINIIHDLMGVAAQFGHDCS